MSIIQGTAKGGGVASFYDFPIGDSLRFDGSSYLSKTFGTPTDNNNYTYSCWFKLSNLSADMQFFASRPTSTPYTLFYYNSSDHIIEFADSSVTAQYSWNHNIRDVSSWYHLVLSVSATGTDRLKLYINNVLNTKSAGTNPSNDSTLLNSAKLHTVGSAMPTTTNYFNGYMANIQFIDGQALDPYFFGESKNGVWIPYNAFTTAGSGTATASDGDTATDSYGTNGFRLAFNLSNFNTSGSAVSDPYGSATNLPDGYVADASGSGNHWQVN
jgi:hypothetical protein